MGSTEVIGKHIGNSRNGSKWWIFDDLHVLLCEFKAEVLTTALAPLSSAENNLAVTSVRKNFEML